MRPAALPRGAAQEGQPERPVLAGADIDAQHLALAVGVDGDDDAHLGDAALLAHALGERFEPVEPELAVPAAIERPIEESFNDAVEVGSDARHLALGDALAAERAP